MKNLNEVMTVTILSPESQQKWNKRLESQSILLFDGFQDLFDFNLRDLMDLNYTNPIRFLVYCQNVTDLDLKFLETKLVIPPYYYFIIVNKSDSKINLWTFENRKDLNVCHEKQLLVLINEFSSTALKWVTEPIFPKKYKNFHRCTMCLGMYESNLFSYTKREASGLLDDILKVVSSELNFVPRYIVCTIENCMNNVDGPNSLYNIVQQRTLDGYAAYEKEAFKWTSVMLNIECAPQLYVPPGDLYTSFEKLALPFDKATWIGLLVTFVSAIVSVLLVNQLPKRLKSIFCTRTVGEVLLNIFRSFFGVGQPQLPQRNFGRFILLSFVLWCLVIRTAYQGKLFEFTTTAIRKPEMRTLKELREKHFTLYIPKSQFDPMEKIVSDIIRLKTTIVPDLKDYAEIYMQNLTDPSFTGTILTCDIEHEITMYFTETHMPKRFVSTPITKSYYALGFVYPNLWNERFEEIMSGLITGGIVNWFLQKYTKSKWNLMTEHFETEKVVLNMSHLGFGFQICIFALYAAFLVFLMELIVFWCRSKKKHKIFVEKALNRQLNLLTWIATEKITEKVVPEQVDNTNDLTTDLLPMSHDDEDILGNIFSDKVETLQNFGPK